MHLPRGAIVVLLALLGPFLLAQDDGASDQEKLREMRRLGYTQLYAQDFVGARAHFTQMIEAYPDRWEGYYDMACWNLRQKELDPALDWLHKAIENGCDDISFFKTDSDLRRIRRERPEEFKELLSQVEAKARAAQEKMVMVQAEALAKTLPRDPLFAFDFELPQHLTEGNLSLRDLKGKVVIVDIWGTWCGPCRMEVPHFVELASKYRDVGLRIVGINYEKGVQGRWLSFEEANAKVQREAKALRINYSLVHGTDAVRAQVPNFRGFPTTLFVDHEGNVKVKEVGYKKIEELEPIVLALLSDRLKAEQEGRLRDSEESGAETPSEAGSGDDE